MTPPSRAASTQAHRHQLLGYAAVVVVLGPLLSWAVFVLPGWL